uniref:Sulfur globule protein CV1 n=1 Tax=Magnetococcus massalia (strain MO-1) TaxID=451514 RepID=A0A1S7LJF3_MAGMO|nr:conserved exported protein of unknown function [similar to sulfur globule protein from Chromatium vinosum] [Candidatus Magnetococcus massalia]
MKKTARVLMFAALIGSASLVASTDADAWWGPGWGNNGWGNNGWGNGLGNGWGDGNFKFTVHGDIRALTNGMANGWGNNGWNNGWAPWGGGYPGSWGGPGWGNTPWNGGPWSGGPWNGGNFPGFNW